MTTPDKEKMPTDMTAGPLATSLSQMIIEWVDSARGRDWRGGLTNIIQRRLDRFQSPSCNAYEPMRKALEKVMVGGNHLGLIIGADHPPHTANHEEARAHYGDAIWTYEVWCCWKTIMEARPALSTLPVNDRHNSGSDNERLREALAALVGDVLDYERRNEIYPNPGRQFCWQSTENAVAVLISLGVWQLPVSGDVAVRDALKGTDRQTSDDAGRLREALSEALPLVEQAEFLESRAFSYGGGGSEPSPSEWGISVGYQQTREAMPHAQFLAEVADFHCENREEDDGDGKFLTVANKIRAALKGVPQPAPQCPSHPATRSDGTGPEVVAADQHAAANTPARPQPASEAGKLSTDANGEA